MDAENVDPPRPSVCSPKAYDMLQDQLPRLSTTEGLVRAAIAVSVHALDDVDPASVVQSLESLADRVRLRAGGGRPRALLAHLHEVLFNEEGFRGNIHDYYNPLNSYLPVVLEHRKGIPISLALVYYAVADRLGLPCEGVNAPGHFLVRVNADGDRHLLDPFHGGGVLTEEEAFCQIEHTLGQTLGPEFRRLPAASHREWIVRMLNNLLQIFLVEGRRDDYRAMQEMQALVCSFRGRD